MGERIFAIYETNQISSIGLPTITEDELNKRWKIIRTLIYMHVDDKDLTNALLHSAGYKEYCVCGKPLGHKEPCPPADDSPIGTTGRTRQEYREAVKAWLKHMPKKGK